MKLQQKTVWRRRSAAVAITTRECYIRRGDESGTRRQVADNGAKHRAWFLATLRRQLVNRMHCSTRRSMSQRGS